MNVFAISLNAVPHTGEAADKHRSDISERCRSMMLLPISQVLQAWSWARIGGSRI
jgi:hypothetical protein